MKKLIYILLWFLSLTIIAVPLYITNRFAKFFKIAVFAVCAFQIFSGIIGMIFLLTSKQKIKSQFKAFKLHLIPLWLIILFPVLVSLFSFCNYTDFPYIKEYLFAGFLFLLVPLFQIFWEIDFIRTVKNGVVRVIFCIINPLLLLFNTMLYMTTMIGW